MGKTLFGKVWHALQVTDDMPEGPSVLYNDMHLTYEFSNPQKFAGLEKHVVPVHLAEHIPAAPGHGLPTRNQLLPINYFFSGCQAESCINFGRKDEKKLFWLTHLKQDKLNKSKHRNFVFLSE